MAMNRRDILKSLTAGLYRSVLAIRRGGRIHSSRVHAEKVGAPAGVYKPKYFSEHQYKTLRSLCQTIIPADDLSGGALEAGAPEFIDLLTSENEEYQLMLGGVLMWLDATCVDRCGQNYLECSPAQQKEILDLISYRKNAKSDPSISQGIEFFAFLRGMTVDGYFTSEIGIKDLGYVGNTFVKGDFPGCPPVPEN
jgi:hypothetical protein